MRMVIRSRDCQTFVSETPTVLILEFLSNSIKNYKLNLIFQIIDLFPANKRNDIKRVSSKLSSCSRLKRRLKGSIFIITNIRSDNCIAGSFLLNWSGRHDMRSNDISWFIFSTQQRSNSSSDLDNMTNNFRSSF